MMIEPPIDQMIIQTGCKYALVCLVAKRARFLLDKRNESMAQTSARAVSVASKEIHRGNVVAKMDA